MSKHPADRRLTTDFYHLTLNTGHVVMQPRSVVSTKTMERLRPCLKSEGGAVPGIPGYYLDFYFPVESGDGDRLKRRPGAAFFQVAPEPGLSKMPLVMCVGCWRESESQESWQKAIEMSQSFVQKPISKMPPRTPYLAVCVTPFFSIDLLRNRRPAAKWLGDLERCVAWTLVAMEEEEHSAPA